MNENVDVQDFAIDEQEVTEVEAVEVDPLDELVSLDFTEDLDVDQYHEQIQKLKGGGVESEELKQLEAENIIKDLGPKYLSEETQKEMTHIAQGLTNYIKKFAADGDEMKAIDETENPDVGKDKVYELANFLFNNFISKINTIEFSMELTMGEWKFLDITLRQKTEFDGNDVLNIITLLPKIEEWKTIAGGVPRGAEVFMVDINIQDVVMVYHFISKYKVKGFGKELENFYNVLTKIGETNKIFNAYNIIKDRLGEDFKQWATTITIDAAQLAPTLETAVVHDEGESRT